MGKHPHWLDVHSVLDCAWMNEAIGSVNAWRTSSINRKMVAWEVRG